MATAIRNAAKLHAAKMALVGLALAVGGGLLATPVQASPDAATDVKAQLEQYEAEQATISQQLSVTQQRLDNARRQLDQTRAEIVARQATIDQMQADVTQLALIQWQSQGMDSTVMMFGSQDVTTMMADLTAAQWMTTTTQDLLRRFQLDQTALAELEASQASTLTAIEADQATVEQLMTDADAKVSQTQQLLKRLTGQEQAAIAKQRAAALAEFDWSTMITSTQLIKPVRGSISSPFGWRSSPITGASELHDGVDYSAPCGTPVLASANGVVEAVEWYYGYGNRVVVDHGVIDGHHIVTSYYHLSSAAVTVGAPVTQGQIIAYVGSTGQSTGCHLHLCVFVDQRAPFAKGNADGEDFF
ncbi:MAG: peptidoglycan DD-metalloendopeptidase family protein [Propionibacteriaceae bacterium]|jgi:murein DD-endopeptidase MepM/ murein hydrolase activator NlpD|nr:peptidoglycan DD-metalloendopeptidase family protein [Propionibacteriaceae bacterium]